MPAKQRAGSKPKAKVASSSTRGERQDDGPVESERSNTEAGGGQQRVKKKGVSWTPVFKRIGFFLLLFLIPGLLNYAVLNQEARMLIPEGTNLRGGEGRRGEGIFILNIAGGTLYDIGWNQKMFLKCTGQGLPTGNLEPDIFIPILVYLSLYSLYNSYLGCTCGSEFRSVGDGGTPHC